MPGNPKIKTKQINQTTNRKERLSRENKTSELKK